MITVTVVTPSFQQARFLAATLESVLSQEGDFALDYVVVDGASRDGSVDVLKRYEALLREGAWPIRCRGVRFRWSSEPDAGQSEAIGKGMRLAEGDVLAWLNSDDTYLPGAVARAAACLAASPSAVLVHGRAQFVDEGGRVMGEVDTGPTDHRQLATLNRICQPSAFFRRSAWEEVGGLDPALHYTMDHDLWIRMAQKGPLAYLDDVQATYRLHGESKTMAARHAVAFNAEILQTVKRHYGWAPANRVYGYCRQLLRLKAPGFVLAFGPLRLAAEALLTAAVYLQQNRGVLRPADLRLLTRSNLARVWAGGRGGEKAGAP